MNDQNFPFLIRIYIFARKGLQNLLNLFTACFTGFWLGILKRETLHFVDMFFHDDSKIYSDEKHNRRGLWKWEQKGIENYFQKCKSILVAGVGGGREVLALRKLGYEVEGFECNQKLLNYANKLLSKEGLAPDIKLASRDQCPDSTKIYDGLIIGYNTYMLIKGRKQRIAFLKKLRTQTRAHSPILLSFYSRSDNQRRFKVIAIIGNVMRFILRREPVELGDDFYPYYLNSGKGTRNCLPYYVHYFSREEVASDLREGGFELDFYNTDAYGHAIGIASEQSNMVTPHKT